MTQELINSVVTVLTAIVGVALLAVLVSKQANTANVITSAGKAFATDLQAAVSPVTGTGLTGGGANLPTIGQ